MLQTCTRCKSRRVKCDSNLPACTNCAKNDLECTFRDDALQEDIPRRYIQSLNERIANLTSQLALHRSPIDPQLDLNGTTASLSADSFGQHLHVLIPGRPGSDLHLDNSIPSHFTRIVFEALAINDSAAEIDNGLPDNDYSPLPNISYADRSQLTPGITRFLLGRYNRCIRPQYDVPVPELLNHDAASFKKLPDSLKFKVLMACAIAAAREAYKQPNWKPLAQICRDWANEPATPIISAGDSDSLAAIILLLIYELAEPGRGIIWELLDLAARTCLQLGWHQVPLIANPGEGSTCGPDEIRLTSVLKDIQGSLRSIFNRPTMLSGSKLPTTSEDEQIYDLYLQVSEQVFGRGQVYENQACPFVGEVATLLDLLETQQTQHPVVKETWLTFLPVCYKHKQCLFCFQEPDDNTTRGMRTLRQRIVTEASELISIVHRTASSQDNFIPPILASSRALTSGCSIAVAIIKRWTPPQTHTRDLIKCSEILTMFAPHWKGGNDYLTVWRTVIDYLGLEHA